MCLPLKPYKIEREWKHAGLSCAVILGHEGGHRCGYVRVPPGHPLHGKDYNEFDVSVHGGLTFAAIEPCSDHEDGQGYWFGFDCAHCYDASCDPDIELASIEDENSRRRVQIHRELDEKYPNTGEHYWTHAEVVAETERLANQLAIVSAG